MAIRSLSQRFPKILSDRHVRQRALAGDLRLGLSHVAGTLCQTALAWQAGHTKHYAPRAFSDQPAPFVSTSARFRYPCAHVSDVSAFGTCKNGGAGSCEPPQRGGHLAPLLFFLP